MPPKKQKASILHRGEEEKRPSVGVDHPQTLSICHGRLSSLILVKDTQRKPYQRRSSHYQADAEEGKEFSLQAIVIKVHASTIA